MEEINGDKRIDFIFMTDIKINEHNIKEILQQDENDGRLKVKGLMMKSITDLRWNMHIVIMKMQ